MVSAFSRTGGSDTKGSGTERNGSDTNESLLFRPSSSMGVREELGSTVPILCLIAHSGSVVETLVPRKYATMILSYASNNKKMLLVDKVKFTS